MIYTYVPDYVVFDLETTGLNCKTDDVIEISAIKVMGGKPAGEFSTLVNPGYHIPYQASSVNGILDDMVQGCPDFREALDGFLEFAGDMVLVGHNIKSFDLKFLYRDAMKFWGKKVANEYADTVIMSRIYLPGMSHTLSSMAEHFGASTEGAHRALADCKMTYYVYEGLKDVMDKRLASGDVKCCPKCGSPLMKRNGKFGEFWGCVGYPACRYTERA